MGFGEDLALAVGKVMAPSGLWSLAERKGCHQDKPLLGIRVMDREGQGSGVGGVVGNSWQGPGGRPSLTMGRPSQLSLSDHAL